MHFALRKAQGRIPPAQRFSYLSVACLTPVRKAPRYFILSRAVRLSPYSLLILFMPGRFPNRASPASKRCAGASTGCRQLAMDARPRRVRIRLCLLRASLRKPSLLLRVAWPNQSSQVPSSVLSSTASASNATICSASLPIDLMPSSAPTVTKAELP